MNTRTFDLTEFLLRSLALHTSLITHVAILIAREYQSFLADTGTPKTDRVENQLSVSLIFMYLSLLTSPQRLVRFLGGMLQERRCVDSFLFTIEGQHPPPRLTNILMRYW